MKPTAPDTSARLAFGTCELRQDTRELWVDGVRRPLRSQVFDLIVHLIRRRPNVVRHDELMRVVWRRHGAAQSALARAVMEARQACGDAADDPRYFVSVHGVGYRFAGQLHEVGAPAAPPRGDAASADPATEELRAMVRQARLSVAENRPQEARRLAEEALALAQALGMQPERVQALLVCSAVATTSGQLPEAARLASQALQIALSEAPRPLVAEARLAVGGVHLLAGDRDTGIRHLREAAEVFSAPGLETDLARCLGWLSRGLRDQGELESALQVCRRGIEVAARCPGQPFATLERLDELHLLIECGDRLAELGEAAGARRHFEDGVEAAGRLLDELTGAQQGVARAMCLDHRSVLLERLGRHDEARAAARACGAEIDRLPEGTAWPAAGDRPRFRMQRARLLAGDGQLEAALAEAQDVLRAAALAPPSDGLADLYRLGADIASGGGHDAQAAQWLRQCGQVMLKAQRQRAASLATVLAAELNADALRDELERVRLEVRDVMLENAELRRHVRLLEEAVEVAPQTGLAAGARLAELMAPAVERARLRGLPMCLGLLQPAGAGAVAGMPAPQLRLAAEVLAAHPDISSPAFDLGAGCIAFHVRDAGLPRARLVAQELLAQLASRPGAPAWQCAVADAAQAGALDDGLRPLAQALAGCAGDGRPPQPAAARQDAAPD